MAVLLDLIYNVAIAVITGVILYWIINYFWPPKVIITKEFIDGIKTIDVPPMLTHTGAIRNIYDDPPSPNLLYPEANGGTDIPPLPYGWPDGGDGKNYIQKAKEQQKRYEGYDSCALCYSPPSPTGCYSCQNLETSFVNCCIDINNKQGGNTYLHTTKEFNEDIHIPPMPFGWPDGEKKWIELQIKIKGMKK